LSKAEREELAIAQKEKSATEKQKQLAALLAKDAKSNSSPGKVI
jgi:hypothetical protein